MFKEDIDRKISEQKQIPKINLTTVGDYVWDIVPSRLEIIPITPDTKGSGIQHSYARFHKFDKVFNYITTDSVYFARIKLPLELRGILDITFSKEYADHHVEICEPLESFINRLNDSMKKKILKIAPKFFYFLTEENQSEELCLYMCENCIADYWFDGVKNKILQEKIKNKINTYYDFKYSRSSGCVIM